MDRNHTAPFSKKGPRALRMAKRDALASIEQGCEQYVRDKMKPQLVAAARQSVSCFKKETGR